MITKYFQIYKREHRLKIGVLKLVVTFFNKTRNEYLGTWKFAKTWKFLMGIGLFKVNNRSTKARCQNSWEKSVCNFIVKLQAYKWVATLLNIYSFSTIYHDFAKIISYLSGSRNSQFQETPLNGCFRKNSLTRVVKIWK